MSSQPRPTLTAPIRRIRFVWVTLLFIGWTGLIGGRLFWLQIVRHHEWVERAAKQQQRTFEVAPRRGVLYDRNLRELAVTVLADSIYAVPSELGENRANVANLVASIVHADPTDSFTSESSGSWPTALRKPLSVLKPSGSRARIVPRSKRKPSTRISLTQ